ncbi:MAG TPA: hypothetical protein DEF89_12665 [Desulfosporosinus sp.]|nr:hypothetical protein [Desulfosporosinus sp.]
MGSVNVKGLYMNDIKMLDEVYNMITIANNKLFYIWATQIVFTWRWWLEIILIVLPWIVWVKIRNRKDTVRLLFIGLSVAIATSTFDNIGISYGLWHYDWKPFPCFYSFFPWNYSLFPVVVMLLLQFKPKVNPIIKAVGFAFLCAFVCEPFANWIALYDLKNWEFWYSFIIYIPLYLIFNYIYNSRLFNNPYRET